MRKLRSKFGRNEAGTCALASWLAVDPRASFKPHTRADVHSELLLSLTVLRSSGIDDNRKKALLSQSLHSRAGAQTINKHIYIKAGASSSQEDESKGKGALN